MFWEWSMENGKLRMINPNMISIRFMIVPPIINMLYIQGKHQGILYQVPQV